MKPGALVIWHEHDPQRASRGLVMVVYTNGKVEVIWHTSVGWQRGCYETEMLEVLKDGFVMG